MRALRVAYGETLVKLGEQYPELFVFDADLSVSTQTVLFAKKYPERHFNMGIAECNTVLFASGTSRMGHPVFASSFAMFLAGRAWEMVRNSVAHDNLNVKLVATHAGISVGEDGSSHQCIEDIAIMRSIPKLQVFSPADYNETRSLIEYSMTNPSPMYIRLSRELSIDIFPDDYVFCPFVPTILKKHTQSRGLIFTTGLFTGIVKQALELLEKEQLFFDHIHVSTLKPIDFSSTISSLSHYHFLMSFEEHNIIGGLGDALLGEIATVTHPPFYKVGVPDVFGRSGKSKDMFTYFGLDIPGVQNKIKQVNSLY